jgi:hypothetical protein
MKQFTLLQLLLLFLVGFIGFKWGQNVQKNREQKPAEVTPEETSTEFNDSADEEIYVAQILNELRKKPKKTQKDKYNIGLLEVKLQQLRKRK